MPTNVKFFWVGGTQSGVTFKVSVTASIVGTDHTEYAGDTASAYYTVEKPTMVTVSGVPGRIYVSPSPVYQGEIALEAGLAEVGNVGMNWSDTINAPADFGGFLTLNQLINTTSIFTPPGCTSGPSTTGFWVDGQNEYFGHQVQGAKNANILWQDTDSPGTIFLPSVPCTQISRPNDQFVDHFMYMPTVTVPNVKTIWVPLALQYWSWNGTATFGPPSCPASTWCKTSPQNNVSPGPATILSQPVPSDEPTWCALCVFQGS